MKKIAANEDKTIVRIPDIARIVVVGVEPALAIRIAIHIENATIAVRVDFARNAAHFTIL